MQRTVTTDGGQLTRAMKKIEAEVREGLRHGHFEIEILSSVANEGTRDLVLKAGKNYRFRIPKDEAEAQ